MGQPEHIPGDLTGKVILITGGSSGLGAASAIALARRNPACIYIAGRRAKAAESVMRQIRESNSGTETVFLPCDLGDLASVRAAADQFLARESRLDVLLANAGVAAVPPATTKDGYEVHFGTNHVGHALLIRKLLPVLQVTEGGGRIVAVTSFGYRFAVRGIPFDQIKQKATGSDWVGIWRWTRYAESKLANIVYVRELARRYPEVVSVAVSPGFVETEMMAGMRACDRLGARMMAFFEGGMVTPEEGARNQIWAATVEEAQLRNGALYMPVGVLCKDLSTPARDEKLANRLWEWTEKEIEHFL